MKTPERRCMWCFGTKTEVCPTCLSKGCLNCKKGRITCTWCGGTGKEPSSSAPEEDELGFLIEVEDDVEVSLDLSNLNSVEARKLRRKGVKGVKVGAYERKDHKKKSKKGSWSKYS
jgi:hypothetical protein